MPNLVGIHLVVWAPNPNKQTDRQASFICIDLLQLPGPEVHGHPGLEALADEEVAVDQEGLAEEAYAHNTIPLRKEKKNQNIFVYADPPPSAWPPSRS